MFCAYCGGEVGQDWVVCIRCGCPIGARQPNLIARQYPSSIQQYPQVPTTQGQSDGLGVASMILGIFALLSVWFYGLGVLLAIPAIILGAVQQSIKKSGMATAGIVLGIITLVVVVLFVVAFVAMVFLVLMMFPYY
ncbi:MAG: DUF4190 domain-containing protein [Firmicutes bacterium]|nr:DUF4190 domain-containing protein [Bacillota bacterium]